MEVFPAKFPAPTTRFGADQASNVVRTKMDAGNIRQRRRYSVESVTVGLQWELDDDQMEMFVAWHKYKINLGSDWFEISLPLGGGMVVHVARFVEGRFAQDYDDVMYWRVSAALEIQVRVTPTEAELNAYLAS